MNFIDNIIDRITMYRLVLYYLIALLAVAVIFGFFGIIPYSPTAIVLSTTIILVISWISNAIFAYVFEAPTNVESIYITALILALIITPIHSIHDLPFLGWAALWSMASKYMFAIGKKHIFNPVAIAMVITAFGLGQSASWWVGTLALTPFVVIGGLLIVRKIHREDLVFSFFITALITMSLFTIINNGNLYTTYQRLFFNSSLFFLGFVMLTEPLTTPPTKNLQILYGALVGFLFVPQMNLFGIFSTPELALVIGNVFSYVVSPKQKLLLRLQQRIHFSSDMVDFVFSPNKKFSFRPGQYMEWTLPHKKPDSRGNRRYFTIASSPTEETVRLGVRFNPNGSSYKKMLAALDTQTPVVASQLAGDFTLPKNKNQKLAFIAGGIGITPFRSMIKYLLDTKETRDIVLFYANKTSEELMYVDIFNQAYQELGIRTFYTVTDESAVPQNWPGLVGRVDEHMIETEVPDYHERTFYLSGPHMMVTGFEKTLQKMGLRKNQIKKDYFPGFV